MKKLITFTFAIALTMAIPWTAWGERVTLKTIDFSTWENQTICPDKDNLQQEVNGVTFLTGTSNNVAKSFTVADGVLTFCDNNISSSKYYLGFSVEGINSNLYVSVYNGTSNLQVKYVWKEDATTFSNNIGSSSTNMPSSAAFPATLTLTTDKRKGYFYIGRTSTTYKNITKIVIETDAESGSESGNEGGEENDNEGGEEQGGGNTDTDIDAPTLSVSIASGVLTTHTPSNITIASTQAVNSSGYIEISTATSQYISIKAPEGKVIDKVAIEVTGNGKDKTLDVPFFGFEEYYTNQAADHVEVKNCTCSSTSDKKWLTTEATDWNASEIRIYKGYKVSNDLTYGGTNTVRVYAIKVWLKDKTATYDVTYNSNIEGVDAITHKVAKVEANLFTVPAGKLFKEWNKLADGSGDRVEVGADVTEPMELYAIWEELPPVHVTSIALSGEGLTDGALTLTEGETATLTATLLPADATNENVVWTSSNEEVATVEDGVIKALQPTAEGETVTITATPELPANESVKATCTLTVNAYNCPTQGDIFKMTVRSDNTVKNIAHGTTESAMPYLVAGAENTYGARKIEVGNNNSSSDDKMQIAQKDFCLNGNDGYVHIKLMCPLQAGDVLTFTTTNNNKREFYLTSSATRSETIKTSGLTYTIPAGNVLLGTEENNYENTDLYIWRVKNATYLNTLTINRPVRYTITYVTTDGTGEMSPSIGYNAPAVVANCEFAAPTGMQFKEWQDADHNKVEIGAEYSEDITLYAVWEEIPMAISNVQFAIEGVNADFSFNDGVIKVVLPNDATIEVADIDWENALSYDLSFEGINAEIVKEDDIATQLKLTFGERTPVTYTINATKASAPTYAIHYENLKEGAVNPNMASYEEGVEYTFEPLNADEVVGYDFAGWAVKVEDDYQAITAISTTITGEFTVYAQWTLHKYSITYEGMEGATNNAANPETYTIESEEITFAAPTKEEYDFNGWTTIVEGAAVAITSIQTGSTGDITITANWLPALPTCGTVYETKCIANPEGATATLSSATVQSAELKWSNVVVANANEYVATSSSKGYYTLTFARTYALKVGDMIRVKYGSANSRDLYLSLNDAANVEAHKMENEKSTVITADYALTKAIDLTSLKVVSSGGGSAYFFSIELIRVCDNAAEPEITAPVNQLYCDELGENALTISASVEEGAGTLTYQWQKQNGENWEDIDGEESSYTPTAVGTYRCQVTNSKAGYNSVIVNSDAATVSVIASADITTPEITQEMNTITITCETEGTIRYTLDGNEPTNESAVYTNAFEITENKTVKAALFVGECNGGTATLNAQYKTYCTVTFVTNGGSEIESVQILSGETLAEPTAPTKPYHTFAGWYSDEELNNAVTFPLTITGPTTLYAKWTANYASSVNFLDYISTKPTIGSVLSEHNIASENINTNDNSNWDEKTDNARIYNGYKLKANGATLSMLVEKGKTFRLTMGYVDADCRLLVGNAEYVIAESKSKVENPSGIRHYTFTVTEDTEVKIISTTKNTVVLKEIYIGEALPAEVALIPGVVENIYSPATYTNLTVGANAQVNVNAALTVENLILQVNGNDKPQMLLNDDVTVTGNMYCEWIVTIGQNYRISMPCDVNLDDIKYWDGNDWDDQFRMMIAEYDGAKRAANGEAGEDETNWKHLEGEALEANKGYIIRVTDNNLSGDIKLRFSLNNMLNAQKVTENTSVSVAANAVLGSNAKEFDKGWNFVGNPFLSAATASGLPCYITKNEGVSYTMTEEKVAPFTGMFVQVGNVESITFSKNYTAPSPIRAENQEDTEVIVKVALDEADYFGLRIADKYTTAYELTYDLLKMFGSAQTMAIYSMEGNTRLAYNAMPNASAEAIPVGFSATEGEHTIALINNPALEHLYLIDHLTGIVTDLLSSDYTFESDGEMLNDTRFELNAVRAEAGQTTAIYDEYIQGAGVQKVLMDGKVYIIRNGVWYDVTGRIVK